MTSANRSAILALIAAGVLWGLSVPLSKISLGWLSPAWLTVVRFAFAAPLLAVAGRRGLRDALSADVVATGAFGFGAVILLQNAGIARTSVSHAAVLVGALPMLVALMSRGRGEQATPASAWGGYALALAGIALVACSGAGAGGGSKLGDGLVLASAAVSAAYIARQPRVLHGRDAVAVTSVQFAAGALVALPVAAVSSPIPPLPAAPAPLLAVAALCVAGTLLPFPLFAFGQARVPAALAGAFVNLEPVVGAAAGWLAFGDAVTILQLAGAVAVLGGIALSTMPAPEPRSERAHARAVDRLRAPATARRLAAGPTARLL